MHGQKNLKICGTICVFRRKRLAGENNVTASRKTEERKKNHYLKETLRLRHDRNI